MRTVRQEGRREPALARNERILRLSSTPPFATTSDTHGWPLKNARGVVRVANCVHVSTSASRTSRLHPSITDAASETEQAQQLRIQIPTVCVRHHPAAARPTRHADVLAARLQAPQCSRLRKVQVQTATVGVKLAIYFSLSCRSRSSMLCAAFGCMQPQQSS